MNLSSCHLSKSRRARRQGSHYNRCNNLDGDTRCTQSSAPKIILRMRMTPVHWTWIPTENFTIYCFHQKNAKSTKWAVQNWVRKRCWNVEHWILIQFLWRMLTHFARVFLIILLCSGFTLQIMIVCLSVVAYIGDVVFELYIRSRHVWPQKRTSDLQNKVVAIVRGKYFLDRQMRSNIRSLISTDC